MCDQILLACVCRVYILHSGLSQDQRSMIKERMADGQVELVVQIGMLVEGYDNWLIAVVTFCYGMTMR